MASSGGADFGVGDVAVEEGVELEKGDVAAVVEENGTDSAALSVDTDVFVVLAQVEVLDIQSARFGACRNRSSSENREPSGTSSSPSSAPSIPARPGEQP